MQFSADEDFALRRDAADPLRGFRDRFHLPMGPDGRPLVYFAGNSLGLMPKEAAALVQQELDDWARLAVDGHFDAASPWYSYHETVRDPLARLVGALPDEVVCMNTLTVNLHLMMATFYRPNESRFRILMDAPAFPSDTYAVKSQIVHHGLGVDEALLLVGPRGGEGSVERESGGSRIRIEDIEAVLEEHGERIALLLLAGVNFFTGQRLDLERITAAAHRQGCVVGIDLAHAAGNVPLSLHDWDIDFAVWCSYKYLNAGPGAVAGAFVHQRHASNTALPRLAGWWGNDPATRFRMHLEPEFVPVQSADAWALSNPPILSMAPLRSSLALFDEAGGMPALRAKSVELTGYLEFLLQDATGSAFTLITPREPDERGCQLSIIAHRHPKQLFGEFEAAGVKCDFREPNVIRAAPTPLYNSFHEVWRFAKILVQHR